MKILVVGGGSGGHITPAVAVIRKILEQRPEAKIEFWTNRKYFQTVVKMTTELEEKSGRAESSKNSNQKEKTGKGSAAKRPSIRVRKLSAGKFNRYAGWGVKEYLQNWKITMRDLIFRNIGGFFGFLGGWLQSFFRLCSKKNRPDVIFLKGGFVGLPVGMIAKRLKIPYVIHESDATPGLANRLLMDQAAVVATGFDQAIQGQNRQIKTVNVGIPVAPEFHPVSAQEQRQLKKIQGFDPDALLTVVIGGSQGSENINEAIRGILPEMLQFTSVGLVAGRAHYAGMQDLQTKYEIWDGDTLKTNFRLWEFHSAPYELMGAADIVISRAGATTIAELAALAKAVVVVPFERLPGAHQAKNAYMLEQKHLAVVVSDEKMQKNDRLLLEAVQSLAKDPQKREELARNLHKTARPDAAAHLAKLIIEVGSGETPAELQQQVAAQEGGVGK